MVPFKTRSGEPDILVNTEGPGSTNVALDIVVKDGPCDKPTVVTAELALSITVGKLIKLTVLSAEVAVGLLFETGAELMETIEKRVRVVDTVEKLAEADIPELELSICTEVAKGVSGRPEKEITEGTMYEMLRFEDGIVLDSTISEMSAELEVGALPLTEPKGDEKGDTSLVLNGGARVWDVIPGVKDLGTERTEDTESRL